MTKYIVKNGEYIYSIPTEDKEAKFVVEPPKIEEEEEEYMNNIYNMLVSICKLNGMKIKDENKN